MKRQLPLARIRSSITPDWSLNGIEVEAARIQYGMNDILEAKSNQWVEIVWETMKDPMIWFLLITAVIFYFLNYYNQSLILFLATIPLIGMDAFLHWRTHVSTQGLHSKLALVTQVIRNGIEMSIPARELVPGDLVVIAAGQSFPADGVVLMADNLQVDESALTGESLPVLKKNLNANTGSSQEPFIEGEYWGYAGTRILTGRALMRVVFTGRETLYGEIAESAFLTTEQRTPLQHAISKLVFILLIAATIFCIILAGVRFYQGFGMLDALLSAAMLAVAALPDEFPVVFTFFLGVGVYRLARKNALVRRAVSVENIGRITCICSDKTGTITEGLFRLTNYFPFAGIDENQLLYIALLASRKESGDLLDLAIWDENQKKNIQTETLLHTFPFTEDRKRETSIIAYGANDWLFAVKGAPEMVLSMCDISNEDKQRILKQALALASAGNKVIGFAKQIVPKNKVYTELVENFAFMGLLTFSDPPRKDAADAIAKCYEGNIHVLMITGDHPETARAVAREIGLNKGKPNVVLAEDIMAHVKKNDIKYLRTIDVVARAIPSQKLDIVKAMQAAGDIVAVTGDGVNDVPALKQADVGIAMGERGTQSAREAADIVLLDDNFGSIVNAISEGRQLFKNLKSSFNYLLMVHMPFVLSAAIIPLFGYPLLYYPIHIVIIELIIHPTAMLVFQELPVTKKLEPVNRQSKVSFFSGADWRKIVLVGGMSTLIVIISFMMMFNASLNVLYARSFSLAVLMITSAALTAGLAGFAGGIVRVMIVGPILFSLLLIQVPWLADLLAVSPMSLQEWLAVTIIGLGIYGLTRYL